jgi:NAD-dependent deacetylase
MKTIVVLTGAGISAESGIRTFRDNDGLWHKHRVEEVATPEAWERDPGLVQSFYNERRKQVIEASPNAGHRALVELEKHFNVKIITQNVDDLHERAGSSIVYHLHGEIRKSRSTIDAGLVYDIEGWELKMGDLCEKGSQLRPHVVWFGESVPALEGAVRIAQEADILLVVGTSLAVYPAASLIHYVPPFCPAYYVDPNAYRVNGVRELHIIKEKAGKALPELVKQLSSNFR